MTCVHALKEGRTRFIETFRRLAFKLSSVLSVPRHPFDPPIPDSPRSVKYNSSLFN